MAKRRGNPRHRADRCRAVGAKRSRFLDRVRIYFATRLANIFNFDYNLEPEQGDEYRNPLGDVREDTALAFLRTIVQREHDADPELYCCSEVSFGSTDNEEF